jgi:hypothetical protein
MKKLRENGQKAGMGFYMDNVVLAEGAKIEAATGPGSATSASGRSGPARGSGAGRAGPSATPGAAAGRSEKIDVVTLEPTDNDWRFEIWADAILQDFSEAGEKKEKAPPPKPSKPGKPDKGKPGP